ncbi:MAG TPA: hypothetical protein DCR14_10665, partial [Acidimicrobiaceae bacterium]|nr:hypothetical protein [Acidimicrobiaceae bacterium]
PREHAVEPLLREYRDGLLVGRGGYAHSAGTFAVLHAFLANRPLDEVRRLAVRMRTELDQLG